MFIRKKIQLVVCALAMTLVSNLQLEVLADHAVNPWARTIGEAIGLRDVTNDMRNRSERLFPGTPIGYLARTQNEIASSILEAIKCGAPSSRIQKELTLFQQVQQQLNHSIQCESSAARDHGLRTYRRLVEDRLDDLVRDLERCTPDVYRDSEFGAGGSRSGVRRIFRNGGHTGFSPSTILGVPVPPYQVPVQPFHHSTVHGNHFGYSTYMFEDTPENRYRRTPEGFQDGYTEGHLNREGHISGDEAVEF